MGIETVGQTPVPFWIRGQILPNKRSEENGHLKTSFCGWIDV